jgi:hypothetical protein
MLGCHLVLTCLIARLKPSHSARTRKLGLAVGCFVDPGSALAARDALLNAIAMNASATLGAEDAMASRANRCCKELLDRRLLDRGQKMTIKIEPRQRIGLLIVVERAGVDGRGRRRWRCKCDCGNEVVRTASQIGGNNRTIRSCGCLSKKRGTKGHANPNYKHGMWQTAEYRIWASIRRRGRRTTVCPDWRNSFDAFFRDVGPRPSPDMSLTRINNEQGYFPGNVRWATKSERGRKEASEISRERGLYPATGDAD